MRGLLRKAEPRVDHDPGQTDAAPDGALDAALELADDLADDMLVAGLAVHFSRPSARVHQNQRGFPCRDDLAEAGIIPQPADVVEGDEHGKLIDAARNYAEKYNSILLKKLKSKPQ